VHIQIADLPGLELGEYRDGKIVIDIDAAGYGWFVDDTPQDDREYVLSGDSLMATPGAAAGHMDLLTVMAHELGHVSGLDHSVQGVMSDTLVVGNRLVTPVPLAKQNGGLYVEPLNNWASFLPGNVPLGNMGTSQVESPAINWNGKFFDKEKGIKTTRSAEAPGWKTDFVNHLGQSEIQRNPNASLRVNISAGSKILPEVNSLSSTIR
jgi:hypothetical protein